MQQAKQEALAEELRKLLKPVAKRLKLSNEAWQYLLSYKWILDMFPCPTREVDNRKLRQAQRFEVKNKDEEPQTHPLAKLLTVDEIVRLNGGPGRLLPILPNGGRILVDRTMAQRLMYDLYRTYVKPILEQAEVDEQDFLLKRSQRRGYVRAAKQGIDLEEFFAENGFYPY